MNHKQGRRGVRASDPGIRTKEEVAVLLGVSRAAVFATEKRALAKLRMAILKDALFAQLAREVRT